MFAVVQHPTRGEFIMPGFPVKMSASSVPVEPAPLLGADNKGVYGDLLGLTADALAQLAREKAI
jgi:formyl-CoA transferase